MRAEEDNRIREESQRPGLLPGIAVGGAMELQSERARSGLLDARDVGRSPKVVAQRAEFGERELKPTLDPVLPGVAIPAALHFDRFFILNKLYQNQRFVWIDLLIL